MWMLWPEEESKEKEEIIPFITFASYFCNAFFR